MSELARFVDAVKKGDAATVESLLAQDPSLAGARDNGIPLVLLAVYHGHEGLARQFREAGHAFDVCEAAAVGDAPRVKELLAKDAALANAFSDDGFPALGLACFFGHPDVAALFFEAGADVNAVARNPMKVTPLHAAVTRRDAPLVARLLTLGADPNAKQQMGYTALHEAAAKGDVALCDILLTNGANAAAKLDDGKTAADLAAERGHSSLSERLSRLASG